MELKIGGRALLKGTYPYTVVKIDYNNVTLLRDREESIENIRDLIAIRPKEIDDIDMEELLYIAKEQGLISHNNAFHAFSLLKKNVILPKGISGYSKDFLKVGANSVGKYVFRIEEGGPKTIKISVFKASEWFPRDEYSYIQGESFIYYKGYCGSGIMQNNFSGDFLLFDTEEEITEAVANMLKIDRSNR